jgi:hypothetical protein
MKYSISSKHIYFFYFFFAESFTLVLPVLQASGHVVVSVSGAPVIFLPKNDEEQTDEQEDQDEDDEIQVRFPDDGCIACATAFRKFSDKNLKQSTFSKFSLV